MKNIVKYSAVIIALAILLSLAACGKPADEPVLTTPPEAGASDKPEPTDGPAATEAPASSDEPATLAPVADALELPAIVGHYLINESGAMYDLNTCAFVIDRVISFIPAGQPMFDASCVNLVIREDGELMGWHEEEPEMNLGELMDLEYHPTPVHLMDNVIKALPGSALCADGTLFVWSGVQAPGVWETLNDDRKATLLEPRALEGVADIAGWCALLTDGTLVRIDDFAMGNTAAEDIIDTDLVATNVKEVCPLCDYLTNDGVLHVNSLELPDVAKVYCNSFGECCYYVDAEANLRSVYGSMDVTDRPEMIGNVDMVIFDRMILENMGYSYLFVITNNGELWSADDYYDQEPRKICDGAKDVFSDGGNTYILMEDGSLWAYSADENTIYNTSIMDRPGEDCILVKVMDGVAACGAVIDLCDNGEDAPGCAHSTFRAYTEDGHIFVWGYVDGKIVAEPHEVYLMR